MIAGLTIGSASHVSRAKWREAIAHHQLITFFVLAFVFSWYPWIIAIVRGRTSGPNPLGPLIAALIVTALAEGRAGLRTWFGRIVRARIGLHWYAVILGLPVALCGVAVAIMAALGYGMTLLATAAWRELPDRFLFIFLFIGLGEEPGWRGFALPRLQSRHTPLVASLILAPIWALWHLPLLGNEFPPAVIPAFLISLLGGTLIQTWLFNRTKGSVFGQMLFHATVNTVGAGLIFPLYKGANFTLFWYVYAFLWMAGGVAAISLRGPPRADSVPQMAELLEGEACNFLAPPREP
jgi:membrane protease YdiL (CAAX protease family)